jgi:enoyl-CoA hydratase/carnithine racemase
VAVRRHTFGTGSTAWPELALFLDELAGFHAVVIHVGADPGEGGSTEARQSCAWLASDEATAVARRALAALNAPWLVSILVIDGQVGGDATLLALASSLRIATREAAFVDPAWAEGRIPALFAPVRDRRTATGMLRLALGDRLDPAAAAAHGLVDLVAADRRTAVEQAEHWARSAAGTPRSLVAETRALWAAAETRRDADLAADAWARWSSEREAPHSPEQ